MLCFVVKYAHPKKCADAAEAECGQEQRFFGYPPRAALGFPFIDAVHAEGDKGNQQNGEGRELPDGHQRLAELGEYMHRFTPCHGWRLAEVEVLAAGSFVSIIS